MKVLLCRSISCSTRPLYNMPLAVLPTPCHPFPSFLPSLPSLPVPCTDLGQLWGCASPPTATPPPPSSHQGRQAAHPIQPATRPGLCGHVQVSEQEGGTWLILFYSCPFQTLTWLRFEITLAVPAATCVPMMLCRCKTLVPYSI